MLNKAIPSLFALMTLAACGGGPSIPSFNNHDHHGVELPQVGEACSSNGSGGCATGLVCSLGKCIVEHSLPAGTPCAYNVDCRPDLVCDWTTDFHVCRPPRLAAEPCGHDTDCYPGLSCSDDWWTEHRCECPPCPAGQVCGATGCVLSASKEPGDLCAYNDNCTDGNVCLWANAPYVCGPPAALDEACGHDTDCDEGLLCSEVHSICRPICTIDTDCPEGEVCALVDILTSDGVCQPPEGEGGFCKHTNHCEAGLACLEETCATPRQAGEGCESSDECASELHCHPATRVCVSDLAEGQPCPVELGSGNDSCGSGLYCKWECEAFDVNGGTCAPLLSEGDTCERCELFETDMVCNAVPRMCNNGCPAGLSCLPDPTTPAVERCLSESSPPVASE